MLYANIQKKEHSSHITKHDILAAGITGIIAGAAGMTLLALSDKDIRKKVFERAEQAKALLQDWSFMKLDEPELDDKAESLEEDMHKTMQN